MEALHGKHTETEPKAPGETRLSCEDRARMGRLYEEVSGRLQEMALIVARNLGLKTTGQLQPQFIQRGLEGHSHEPAQELRFKGITVVCSPTGCGCYDNDQGSCFAC